MVSNPVQSSGILQSLLAATAVALLLFNGAQARGADASVVSSNFRLTPDTIENIPAGLMLMRTPMGRLSYAEASRRCETGNHLGYSDWRVPSLDDLRAFGKAPQELDLPRYDLFGGPTICGSHRTATYLFVSESELRGQYRYNYVVHCSYGWIDKTLHNAAVVCVRDTGRASADLKVATAQEVYESLQTMDATKAQEDVVPVVDEIKALSAAISSLEGVIGATTKIQELRRKMDDIEARRLATSLSLGTDAIWRTATHLLVDEVEQYAVAISNLTDMRSMSSVERRYLAAGQLVTIADRGDYGPAPDRVCFFWSATDPSRVTWSWKVWMREDGDWFWGRPKSGSGHLDLCVPRKRNLKLKLDVVSSTSQHILVGWAYASQVVGLVPGLNRNADLMLYERSPEWDERAALREQLSGGLGELMPGPGRIRKMLKGLGF